jgi:hypothetical protein
MEMETKTENEGTADRLAAVESGDELPLIVGAAMFVPC